LVENLRALGAQRGRGLHAPAESSALNAAAYVRVSSRAQDLASQRASIERAAAARGDVLDRWFHEKRSAATVARPALVELRAAVRAGEVRRCYVFRLDRLIRTGIRDALEIVDEFTRCGCELVTLADGFSLEGPGRELVLAVLAYCAQQERAAIGERIAAARERIELAGGKWGRAQRMSAEKVKKASAMKSSGKSIREIAVALKVPRSTVADTLARASGKPTPDPPKPDRTKPGLKKIEPRPSE
jgi:DNA invertase Pin-like site-specific DNA recombinase